LYFPLGCATIADSIVDSFDPDSYKIGGIPKSVFYTSEGRKLVAADILNSPSLDPDTPLVVNIEEMNRYVGIFGKACLTDNLNKSAELFSALGMKSVPIGNFKPKYQYYFDPTKQPELYEQIALEYRPVAKSMMRKDGTIPGISGVSVNRKNDNNGIFTDGIAIADIQYGPAINDACSLRIKVPDDSLLIDAFERTVKESGRDVGKAKDNGIIGFGFIIGSPAKEAIILGRETLGSPTNLSYILFK